MTMSEIAQALHVSPASVSIVRKGLPGVSPKTRRKIQQMLTENGYTYQEYAPAASVQEEGQPPRFIRIVKYKNSALLVDKNEGFVEAIIDSIDTHARMHGYALLFSAVSHDEYPDFLRTLSPRSCAGLIVIATEMDRPEIMALARVPIPLVVLDSEHPGLPFSTVTMNNRDIAYRAVNYLFSQGHTQVGYLCSSIATGNFIARANGYREALYAHRRALDESIVYPLRPSADGACEDMLSLLPTRPKPPSAFFADNDIIAIGAMRALISRGYSIPNDVSIIGVDNTPLSQVCVPALSTMQISRFTLGKYAILTLLEQIEDPSQESVHIRVGSSLVSRETIARR